MKKKILVTFMATLLLSACAATNGEKPHSFRTGKDYTVWKADPKIHYVMGLADAFAYLSAKTGHQPSLSDCIRKYANSEAGLMGSFYDFIKLPHAFGVKPTDPQPKNLPAAEAFDQFSTLFCKINRSAPN
jgi:hypothetical protein